MPTVSCTPPTHRPHLSVAVLWFVPLSLMAGAVHCEILVEGEDPSPPSQGFPGGGPVMKAELVPLVAEKAGLTKREADEAVDAIVDVVGGALGAGGRRGRSVGSDARAERGAVGGGRRT